MFWWVGGGVDALSVRGSMCRGRRVGRIPVNISIQRLRWYRLVAIGAVLVRALLVRVGRWWVGSAQSSSSVLCPSVPSSALSPAPSSSSVLCPSVPSSTALLSYHLPISPLLSSPLRSSPLLSSSSSYPPLTTPFTPDPPQLSFGQDPCPSPSPTHTPPTHTHPQTSVAACCLLLLGGWGVGLREFGVQTIRHLCPCVRGVGLLSAVFLSGPPAVHFAQTLRFSRFIACPSNPLEFNAFWAQNRALAEVWRTCVLLTTVFIDWIGPWRSRAQKSALL
jgi:hypothetical protein